MSNIFRLYDVGNLSSYRSFIYLGSTYIANISNTDKTKSDFSTFLFGSIVGGKNVRIDQATEKDPYIFIDVRYYTFKPYNYYVNFIANSNLTDLENNFLPNETNFRKSVINKIEISNNDLIVSVKKIGSDNKIIIHSSKNGDELILKAAEYDLRNNNEGDPKSLAVKVLTRKSKDEYGNNQFHINKLIEGNCLKLDQILEFTWVDVFSSSSSSLSNSSVSSISISDSSESVILSSDSSDSSILNESSSFSLISNGSFECCDLMRITNVNFNAFYGNYSVNWEDRYGGDYDYNDHVTLIRGPLNVVPSEFSGTFRLFASKDGTFTVYTARGIAGDCHEVEVYVNNSLVVDFRLSDFGQVFPTCSTSVITYPNPSYKTFFANEGSEIKIKFLNISTGSVGGGGVRWSGFQYELHPVTGRPATTITNNPPTGFVFDIISSNANFEINEECEKGDINLRRQIETKTKGVVDIERSLSPSLNTRVRFPENLYTLAANNYFWAFSKIKVINKDQAVVTYNLLENAIYTTGIRLYEVKYTKKTPNLVTHEIITPLNSIIETYNNLTSIIPVEDYSQDCFNADISINEEIYLALENNFNLVIETEYNTVFNTLYFNTPSFIRDKIEELENGLLKVTYLVEDGFNSIPLQTYDAILEIIVEKCFFLNEDYNTIGVLDVTVTSCCEKNIIFDNFNSDSSVSDKSFSSGSSYSSSSSVL
jgi:hypothetical protein